MDSGGITINFPTVDWATLIPQLIGYFLDGIGKWIQDTLDKAFNGFWDSGTNIVGRTDPGMVLFGGVQDQLNSLQSAARAILILSLILLGLRGMLGSLTPRFKDVLGDFITGVLVAAIMVTAFPLVLPQIISMSNEAAQAVGSADLGKYMHTSSIGQSPLVEAVLFIFLLFFGFRLLIKSAWRIMFLTVMVPVGFVCCALYALPGTRWLFSWWARVWGGMLLAQIPSVFALSIGTALFANGSGIGAFVFSIAALQLATDLYSIIPFGGVSHSPSPVGEAAAAFRTYAGAAGLAAGVGAHKLAAIPANQLSTKADMYGY